MTSGFIKEDVTMRVEFLWKTCKIISLMTISISVRCISGCFMIYSEPDESTKKIIYVNPTIKNVVIFLRSTTKLIDLSIMNETNPKYKDNRNK